tara:strand:+ start:13 stop:255 length:243 start_codon:yes stop_codon:yes gene_type:complete
MKRLNKSDELDIKDKSKAREIIQVVLDYGINQNQIYHMIYLLALELEKVNDMKDITKLITSITDKQNDKTTGLITTGDEP